MDAVSHRDRGALFNNLIPDNRTDAPVAFPLLADHDFTTIATPAISPGSLSIRREDAGLESGPGLYEAALKWVFDTCIGVMLLLMTAPMICIVALIVKMDGGPAFFGHRRIGRNGKEFQCYKLRSMVVDAETKLKTILAEDPLAAAEWAESHKLTVDPRITWIGRVIRKTSIDELPQLWNVLRGDMSLVGPRPIVAKEVERYGMFAGHYTRMRPGITGLWQVSGRNAISYDERVALDVEYANTVSFVKDFRILLLTARSVVQRTGL